MNLKRTSNVICDKCGRKRARKITYYPEGFQRVHCTACHKSEIPIIERRMDEQIADSEIDKALLETYMEETGNRAYQLIIDAAVAAESENEPQEGTDEQP